MQRVNTGHKSIADYASIVGRHLADEIRELAEPLHGRRVLHLSATAFGGGVAEIQYTLIPLLNDVGIETEWRVIQGRDEFFDVTKTIHNALQGDAKGLTPEQEADLPAVQPAERRRADGRGRVGHGGRPRSAAGRASRAAARRRREVGVALPHRPLDAQPPRCSTSCCRRSAPTTRRSSTCTSTCRAGRGFTSAVIWPPAIDPLAPKNMALAPEDAAYIVEQFGIDPARPMMLQVSRFDPWKDPLGVIDAYRRVKETHPGLQLALVGSMAHDDPEGWEFYNQTVAYADSDPDIYILSNLNNVGAVEVNAFQVHADVCLQKSIREGFGLTVSEALWKARPMIGGAVGGIVTQIEDGQTGYLVSSPDECARPGAADPGRSGRGKGDGAAGQGGRPPPVPDAAPGARLAGADAPAGRRAGRARPRPRDLRPAVRATRVRRMAPRPLLIVSNRGPIRFVAGDDGERTARRGGGGLVTALSALTASRPVTWIASALTEEDAVVAAEGPYVDGNLRLRLVEHDREEFDRYYNVFANPTLWFIHHYLWSLTLAPDVDRNIRLAWDAGYLPVNQGFAEAAAEELERAGDEAPLVMIHDYQLFMVPQFVRERVPGAVIQHFTHIPWPMPDYWRVLPSEIRTAIHESMLACDIVGLHTERYVQGLPALRRRADRRRGRLRHPHGALPRP